MAETGPPGADFMARYDFRSPRLLVAAPLGPGATVVLDAAQAHYLASVLRLKAGAPFRAQAATKQPDGTYTAAAISVGRDGARPF